MSAHKEELGSNKDPATDENLQTKELTVNPTFPEGGVQAWVTVLGA